jgi:hypothetical protein
MAWVPLMGFPADGTKKPPVGLAVVRDLLCFNLQIERTPTSASSLRKLKYK